MRDASGNVMSVYYKDVNASQHLVQTELHLYGSSRLGIFHVNQRVENVPDNSIYLSTLPERGLIVPFERGSKRYELTNHLGNVLATISDRRIPVTLSGSLIDHYEAEVISANDYYPFGMMMPGRKFSASGSYRYGFNGKEQDYETASTSTYDYGFRIFNPALGKFLSVDPLTKDYAFYTPYQFSGNKPIMAIDIDGLEEYIIIKWLDNDQLRGMTVIHIPLSAHLEEAEKAHKKVMDGLEDDIRFETQTKEKGWRDRVKDSEKNKLMAATVYQETVNKIKSNYEGKAIYEIHNNVEGINEAADAQKYAKELLPNNEKIFKYIKGKIIEPISENDIQTIKLGFPAVGEFVGNPLDGTEVYMSIYIARYYPVSFETGSAQLDENGKGQLRSIIIGLLAMPYLNVTLIGHTDNVGSSASNLELSKQRAISAKNHILSQTKKIEEKRIVTTGKGDTEPIASNETEEGKSANRRIEVKLNQ